MSEHSSVRTASGPDCNLPEEILSVIPKDPYDLLDLGWKIVFMGFTSRVSELESEAGMLRHKLNEKDVISELEDKLTNTLEDKMKHTEERDMLATTNKTLLLDLIKALTADIGTYDQSAPGAYPDIEEETHGYRRDHSYSGSIEALKHAGTPKAVSASVSPRRYSASGTTSPPKHQYEGCSSQQSAENSAPRGPTIPGCAKELYRQARSRLSYDQYTAFLTGVIRFNARMQSGEETLRKAEEIFGVDNKDLYQSFQALLYCKKQ